MKPITDVISAEVGTLTGREKIYGCHVALMVPLPHYPNPESLLTAPYEAWYDDINFRWLVRSVHKPKDAFVYGIVWKEIEGALAC